MSDTEPDARDSDEGTDTGLGFRLPPISLPPIVVERFRLGIPGIEVPRTKRRRWGLLLGALLLDGIDAALVLGGPEALGLPRTVVGTVLALLLLGRVGLGYGWEIVGVVVAPFSTLLPSFTLLAVWYGRRRHPEALEGGSNREGKRPEV